VTHSSAQEKAANPLYQPAQPMSGIRDINFKDFTYHPSSACRKEGLPPSVDMQNGEYRANNSYFSINQILYGDLTGDGMEEAVVITACGTDPANYSIAEISIFALRNGRPLLIGTINDDNIHRDYSHYYPSGWIINTFSDSANVKIQQGNIVVERYAEGSHASPQYIAAMKYLWNGNKFVLKGKPQKRTFTPKR